MSLHRKNQRLLAGKGEAAWFLGSAMSGTISGLLFTLTAITNGGAWLVTGLSLVGAASVVSGFVIMDRVIWRTERRTLRSALPEHPDLARRLLGEAARLLGVRVAIPLAVIVACSIITAVLIILRIEQG
jgi:hypothetical protein